MGAVLRFFLNLQLDKIVLPGDCRMLNKGVTQEQLAKVDIVAVVVIVDCMVASDGAEKIAQKFPLVYHRQERSEYHENCSNV